MTLSTSSSSATLQLSKQLKIGTDHPSSTPVLTTWIQSPRLQESKGSNRVVEDLHLFTSTPPSLSGINTPATRREAFPSSRGQRFRGNNDTLKAALTAPGPDDESDGEKSEQVPSPETQPRDQLRGATSPYRPQESKDKVESNTSGLEN